MKTREEWIDLFEEVIGRKPTEIELLAAEKSGYDPKAILPVSEGRVFEEEGKSSQEQTEQLSEDQTEEISASEPEVLPDSLHNGETAVFSETGSSSASKKEMMALPIVSFVLSGIALLVSLFVKSPYIIFSVAFIALVLGILSLVFNFQKTSKTLSIIALPLAIFSFAVGSSVGAYQVLSEVRYRLALAYEAEDVWEDEWEVSGDSALDAYVDESYEFVWTELDFREIDFSGYDGTSGTSIEKILSQFGKADDAYLAENYLELSYYADDSLAYVSITFKQDSSGSWIASDGFAADLSNQKIAIRTEDYQSTWTQADFDALVVGDYSSIELGTKWSDIQAKFGAPTDASEHLSNYGDGFERSLSIYYIADETSDGYLEEVYLNFEEKNGEFYLINKNNH
ncbi:DUF308 domain-containing protein [Streptococcus plurextorum]|uniref:DUF308 domain-containing protein n=1 Tax=Streptococcus plurextorum TaxID=456876 RepID=UPI0004115BFA|nr:DUF308 domain-containing protein [Streptococcus plurextorum]